MPSCRYLRSRVNKKDKTTKSPEECCKNLFLSFILVTEYGYIMICICLDDESLRGNILEAIIVEFPSIDFSIIVGINFSEELIELFLDHLLVEICVFL